MWLNRFVALTTLHECRSRVHIRRVSLQQAIRSLSRDQSDDTSVRARNVDCASRLPENGPTPQRPRVGKRPRCATSGRLASSASL